MATIRSTLRGWRFLLACPVAILAFSGGGCKDGNTVTGPYAQAPTPTPIAPPAFNLAGTWTGTARVRSDDCPGVDQDVAISVTQTAGAVAFGLSLAPGSCSPGGNTTFEGTLSGASLFGHLLQQVGGSSCALAGDVRGTAGADSLQLDGSMHGPCHDTWIHLELTR